MFQCTDMTDEPAVQAAVGIVQRGGAGSMPKNRYTDGFDRGAVCVTRMVAQPKSAAKL